ncbi:SWIM zinc finger family protein [Streptomyces sp. NPDC101225]|uniref:SWIM zinc finger family protein n=1 Tax=Streptomyces sp. NPDC101225 TaxID=3366135 RepID=UPI003815E93A
MTPGPADEARRALREAREREGAAPPEPAPDAAQAPATSDVRAAARATSAASDVRAASAASAASDVRDASAAPGAADVREETGLPDRPGPRPGDAARAALRRTAAAPTPGEPPDEEVPAPAEEPRPRESGPAAARPGDAAREALRAARAESLRAREEAGRRPRRPAPDEARGAARRRAPGLQARDMRELVADALRMPDAAAGPGRADEDEGRPPREAGPGGPPAPVGEAQRPDPHPDPDPDPIPTPNPDPAPHPDPQPDPDPAPHPDPQPDPDPAPHPDPQPDPDPDPHPDPQPDPAPARAASMAAPGRDGELRRTFPAFPSRGPASPAGARFAGTWWGNAWVTALEEGALDAKRLARGRSYAEQGHVDAITVTPGLVLAYVQGSRPRPYRVQVRLRTLDDADWARFLDAAAERPGHIAALLDKELPQSLADCGVPLLPGPRDLDPHCSCPDRGHPCKHAAALCYQSARLLDADPFVLLLLRGRGERELLDALSRLNATRAARAAREQPAAPLPGVRATDVLARDRPPALPAPLPAPAHPEQPPVYPAAPGGPDPFALDQLATDAAARAHALLTTGRDPVAELTLWQDAVRLAAARPGSGLTAGSRSLYASLASAAGRAPAELARAVAAWRQGGIEGLAVLEESWDPPAGRFDRARPLLLAADLPAFRPWRNHLTHPRGHVQLRLGRDGLWYAYESEPGRDDWWPRGTPDLDPVGALTGLGASPEG